MTSGNDSEFNDLKAAMQAATRAQIPPAGLNIWRWRRKISQRSKTAGIRPVLPLSRPNGALSKE